MKLMKNKMKYDDRAEEKQNTNKIQTKSLTGITQDKKYWGWHSKQEMLDKNLIQNLSMKSEWRSYETETKKTRK